MDNQPGAAASHSQAPEDAVIALREHYVYVLSDPRNNEVFYVGKGSGQRAKHHEQEFLREFKQFAAEHDNAAEVALTEELFNHKKTRILELQQAGLSVQQLVVGRYETHKEALAVEATLISWMYGFNNLTNLVKGHGAAFIREKGNFDELPGIDIEQKLYKRTLEFKNKRIAGLEETGAYEHFDALRIAITNKGFETFDFTGALNPYDPGESNGVLGFGIDIYGLQIMLRLTKTRKPLLRILNTATTEESLKLLDVAGIGYTKASNIVVNGRPRYRDFEPKKDFPAGAIQDVVDELVALRNQLGNE